MFFVIPILLMSCSNSKIVHVQNEEINWTVSIPAKFKTVPTENWNEVKNDGKSVIENAQKRNLTQEDAETTLLVYKYGQFHTIEANYKKYSSKDGFKNMISRLNAATYDALAAAMPHTSLDSISSNQIIDGKEFLTQEIKINHENGHRLTSKSFRRLIGGKVFSINVLFKNPSIGEELHESIVNSRLSE